MKDPHLHLSESTAAFLTVAWRIFLSGLCVYWIVKLFVWGVAWPFFFGWLLAYIYRPIVVQLTRWSLPHGWATFVPFALTYLAFFTFFVFFPEYLVKVSTQIGQSFARYYDTSAFRSSAGNFYAYLQKMDPRMGDLVYHALSKIGQQTFALITGLINSGFSLAQTGLTLLFIPLIGFYFAKDWVMIGRRFFDLCPAPYRCDVKRILIDIRKVLAHYLHGQILVTCILAIYYTIVFSVLGIHGSFLIGCLSGLCVLIPYAGPLFAFFVSLGAIVVQHYPLSYILIVSGIYIVGHMMESLLLTPYFVGKKIGLHPLWILFFAYFGFNIGGLSGILASLPLGCILSVLCKSIYRHYVTTGFFHRGFFLSFKE